MTDIQSKKIFSRLLEENVTPQCTGIGSYGETRWLILNKDGVMEQFGILNNELHGDYRIATEEGDEIIGLFQNGKKEGVWHCHTDGKLDEMMVYKNDLLVKEPTDKLNKVLKKSDDQLEKIHTFMANVTVLQHPLRMLQESKGIRNSLTDLAQ